MHVRRRSPSRGRKTPRQETRAYLARRVLGVDDFALSLGNRLFEQITSPPAAPPAEMPAAEEETEDE